MIFSHYHFPFCAGISIRESLKSYNIRTSGKGTEKRDIEISNTYEYKNIRVIESEVNRLNKNSDSLFKVTFVRHPYDRIVTTWNQLMTIQQPQDGELKTRMNLPVNILISKYISERYRDLNEFICNGEDDYMLLSNIRITDHFKSMSTLCKGNWDYFDKICRCEDDITKQIKDIDKEYKLFNLDDSFIVSRLNESEKLFKASDLNDTSKEIIYERQKPDFSNLGYER